jgi:hypothetical protein
MNKLREHIINTIVDATKVEVKSYYNTGNVNHIYFENHYMSVAFRIRASDLVTLKIHFCDKYPERQLWGVKKYLLDYYNITLDEHDLYILLFTIKERIYNKYLIDAYHKCKGLNGWTN